MINNYTQSKTPSFLLSGRKFNFKELNKIDSRNPKQI